MSLSQKAVSPEIVEAFLAGSNPKKYVVAIEASYNEPFVQLIVNDPVTGKKIEKYPYRPFLWFRNDVIKTLYGGKRMKVVEACKKYDIKITKLIIGDDEGNVPERLENGFRFMATCKKSYNNLVNFFKDGGIDVFKQTDERDFFMFPPVEQFMIQTGIRLFKGMDDYDDLHRLQFDLETTGLFGNKHEIFEIGVRDNRGFEHILEVSGNTPQERRDSEREIIIKFFMLIDTIKPDVITGYFSEGFDWQFLVDRCERLNIPIEKVAITLNHNVKFKRKSATLKLGNESENFLQTYLYGYNVIDIIHAVRRAQAINTDIKASGLKYITQFSEVAKPNRVYIPGDKIYTIWSDKITKYAYNDTNGDWFKVSDRMSLKDDYKIVTGSYLIQRYLLDDLWETEKVDSIFNQASFLLGKILPTTYQRSSTMGTASQWKLIMAAWSYEHGLAIPCTEKKRDFTGGLSRLLKVGFSKKVSKEDYAALYPKCELTHDIFPNLDISGVMKGLLTFIVDTRDESKNLYGEEKIICKMLEQEIKDNKDLYTKEDLAKLKKKLKEHKRLQSFYDKKQLPLKILANSWFGAYGAPHIFNWGDTNCAEETTCRSRQYLRLMVWFFVEKHGFEALVLDTDGCNFSAPENLESIRYTATGKHWKTTKDAGKELCGLDAVLAEFNETYMIGRMGLDTDDIYDSTINFARKNYANLDTSGKIKLVGNSIKSKKMPVYIEEFLAKAIKLLLNDKGREFITFYHEYVDKIYNYNIPLVKIASKSKIKQSISDYKKRASKLNKAGKPLPKQAHMELAINAGIDVNLGDVLYYVNTGTLKSHGDLKSTKNDQGGTDVKLNCKLIDVLEIESNMEMIREMDSLHKILIDTTDEEKIAELEAKIAELDGGLLTDEYNVAKYLDAFNKKIKPLLVCFNPDVRSKILLTITKEKKTKIEKLSEKFIFTNEEATLTSGIPYDINKDQDTYEDLMTMEDKEFKFWERVASEGKVPNNIDPEVFAANLEDYKQRMIKAREDGIQHDKDSLEDIFKHLELKDLIDVETKHVLPKDIMVIATIDDLGNLVSRKWDVILCPLNDIFKYEEDAILRDQWYKTRNENSDDRYELWLDYKFGQSIITAPLEIKEIAPEVVEILKSNVIDIIVEKANPKTDDEEDEDDEGEEEIAADEFLPEFQKAEFDVDSRVDTNIESVVEVVPVFNEKEAEKVVSDYEKQRHYERTGEVTVEDEWNF